ncbi:ROK family transcriptional regulator [Amycolatopsis sp. H20-H5]|uniref:ROK family transcriptional regulator n=1 Tax=Amycolatopsis sp. H20-H5 TaxID=3046309 RepID=UPI002DBBA696|nr:ROK family transcriptional regulator [Amycolatopsis sp. H20-H5]MEC3976088.1 ROK family transcriptional regulator [Amycolatopsis sp. H20-H5]
MVGQVGNPASMRELNQRLVLERLREQGEATRPQLAAGTGLSKPTIGQALLDLEQDGLVRTAGRLLAGPGRAAVVYQADPAAGHVVGIDIGRQSIRVAIANLGGSIVARLDEPNRCRSGSALVRTVSGCAERAIAQAGLTRDDVVATVIGTPGVPDLGSATLHRAPNLPGGERKGLLGELEAALGPGLVVENDANLSAVGEYELGAGLGVRSLVCVAVGTGLGLGILVDGKLFRGAHGAAGEIAYLPYGRPREAGAPRQGLMEVAAAARAVVGSAASHGLAARTAKDVFRLAREGDKRARKIVKDEAGKLAFVVASVSAVIDPELVVLSGGIGASADLLVTPLREALARTTPMAPDIVAGQLSEEAVLAGAISTALHTARDLVFDRRSRLTS